MRRELSFALGSVLFLAACTSRAGTPQAELSQPQNVIVVSRDSAVDVSWQAPANGPAMSYRVSASPGNVALDVPASQLAAHLLGLTNGTTYDITVVAKAQDRSSSPSHAPRAVIPGVPDRPTGLSAEYGDGVTLTWQAPLNPGSSPLLSYTIRIQPDERTVTVPAGSTRAYLPWLPPETVGHRYTFTVTANNAFGESEASEPFVGCSLAITVTNVNPNSGPLAGGTSVTITGTNFVNEFASSAKFGATAGTNFVRVSNTSITVTSPAGTGTVDVTVIDQCNRASATSPADRFTYQALTATPTVTPTVTLTATPTVTPTVTLAPTVTATATSVPSGGGGGGGAPAPAPAINGPGVYSYTSTASPKSLTHQATRG